MPQPRLSFISGSQGQMDATGKHGYYMISKGNGAWPYLTSYAPRATFTQFKGVDGGQFKTEEEAVIWCEEYESQFH